MAEGHLLRSVRLLDPVSGTDAVTDIVLEGGFLEPLPAGSPLRGGLSEIACDGLWAFPGLVDMHAHLRHPGDGSAETLESGLRAAVAGGVTSVAAMPNTDPPVDSPAAVREVLRISESLGLAEVLPVACVTRHREGRELCDLEALSAAGAAAFSDDGSPVRDSDILAEALSRADVLGLTVIEHPEDESLSAGGSVDCSVAWEAGECGIPEDAEVSDVERCIGVLGRCGGRLHLTHLSSPDSVTAVERARRSGLRATCDVTPHHMALDSSAVLRLGPLAKMNPPLRCAESRERLVTAVARGMVDAVASDHAPHPSSRKRPPLEAAAFGVTGLETMLPLALEILADGAGMPVLSVLGLLTSGPAAALGLPAKSASSGRQADLVLFDPSVEWSPGEGGTFSLSSNSPFMDRSLRGRVKAVWRRSLVFMDGVFL